MGRLIFAVIAASLSLNCFAQLRVQTAVQVCTLLNDTQLRAGEWITHPDGDEGCSSGARPISATSTDGNRISFLAEGSSGTPNRVKLILKVLLPSDEDAAKREMVRATKRLAVRALGLSIPHSIDEAIMKGLPAKLDVGSGKITVTRTAINKQSYVLAILIE